MTKVDHFSSINHYLHSTNCKRLNFVTGWINLHLNVSRGVYLSWPFNSFRTFDASRYSHHLLHFAWTALLLTLKAKVEKFLCTWLPLFGHVTYPIHINKTRLAKPGLTKLKFLILHRVPVSINLCFHCTTFEVDKHQLTTSMRKTILNRV